MGRGSAYQHKYHMLIDDDEFFFLPEGEKESEFDEEAWGDFLAEIVVAFNAWELSNEKWLDREKRIYAETDRLSIGIDSSGGSPCVFVEPKTYTRQVWGDEFEYKIWREVERGFNKLLALYPGIFRYWTTAWTSEPYTKPYKAER